MVIQVISTYKNLSRGLGGANLRNKGGFEDLNGRTHHGPTIIAPPGISSRPPKRGRASQDAMGYRVSLAGAVHQVCSHSSHLLD